MAKPKEDREQQAADSRMEDKFNTGGTVYLDKDGNPVPAMNNKEEVNDDRSENAVSNKG